VDDDVAEVRLRDEHAVEFCELLEFLGDWLDADSGVVAGSLSGFCAGGYGVGELRADLARFAFLLGGDGERFVLGDDDR
jgi:hypothetical protein